MQSDGCTYISTRTFHEQAPDIGWSGCPLYTSNKKSLGLTNDHLLLFHEQASDITPSGCPHNVLRTFPLAHIKQESTRTNKRKQAPFAEQASDITPSGCPHNVLHFHLHTSNKKALELTNESKLHLLSRHLTLHPQAAPTLPPVRTYQTRTQGANSESGRTCVLCRMSNN